MSAELVDSGMSPAILPEMYNSKLLKLGLVLK